ncbi:MAG: CopD family protein [Gammaproteobacteria bacterium]|nr:CopD family protein [Gammaproteobacteria bacterium]MDP2348335.1 CopD family protein [Gammaproteobacteria bacterium]
MMSNAGSWELAIVFSKALSYFGLASLAGGVFVLWLGSLVHAAPSSGSSHYFSDNHWSPQAHPRLVNTMLLASAVGIAAVTLFYLLQVGVINQMGIAGMFDITMIGLLAQSSVGYGVGLKLAGFVVAGVALLLCRPALLSTRKHLPLLLQCGWLVAAGCFATSFAILGHIAELSLLSRLAIAGHVIVIGLWIGALYPLYVLAGTEIPERVQPLLQLFGRAGWVIIAVLLVTGVYLVVQVLGSVDELFTTAYGLQLLLKLLLVLSLLCLAALNKFRLVPAMHNAGKDSLRRSIMAEMVLAVFILLLTASMTTVTGPVHLM